MDSSADTLPAFIGEFDGSLETPSSGSQGRYGPASDPVRPKKVFRLNSGSEEGDVCLRCGSGLLTIRYPDGGCSCFVKAPCGRCESSYLECSYCGEGPYDDEA